MKSGVQRADEEEETRGKMTEVGLGLEEEEEEDQDPQVWLQVGFDWQAGPANWDELTERDAVTGATKSGTIRAVNQDGFVRKSVFADKFY